MRYGVLTRAAFSTRVSLGGHVPAPFARVGDGRGVRVIGDGVQLGNKLHSLLKSLLNVRRTKPRDIDRGDGWQDVFYRPCSCPSVPMTIAIAVYVTRQSYVRIVRTKRYRIYH